MNDEVWRKTSKMVLLTNDYICAVCGGEATMTDHIISVKKIGQNAQIGIICNQSVKRVTMPKVRGIRKEVQ